MIDRRAILSAALHEAGFICRADDSFHERDADALLALLPPEFFGLDRDTLYRRIHATPSLGHHGKAEQCFPITDAILAALHPKP